MCFVFFFQNICSFGLLMGIILTLIYNINLFILYFVLAIKHTSLKLSVTVEFENDVYWYIGFNILLPPYPVIQMEREKESTDSI